MCTTLLHWSYTKKSFFYNGIGGNVSPMEEQSYRLREGDTRNTRGTQVRAWGMGLRSPHLLGETQHKLFFTPVVCAGSPTIKL